MCQACEPSSSMLWVQWPNSDFSRQAAGNGVSQCGNHQAQLSLIHGWVLTAQGAKPRPRLRMAVSVLRGLPRFCVKVWLYVQLPDRCFPDDVLTVLSKQHCITGCFTYFLPYYRMTEGYWTHCGLMKEILLSGSLKDQVKLPKGLVLVLIAGSSLLCWH